MLNCKGSNTAVPCLNAFHINFDVRLFCEFKNGEVAVVMS